MSDFPVVIKIEKRLVGYNRRGKPLMSWNVYLPEGVIVDITTPSQLAGFRRLNDLAYERLGVRFKTAGAQAKWDRLLNSTPIEVLK